MNLKRKLEKENAKMYKEPPIAEWLFMMSCL